MTQCCLHNHFHLCKLQGWIIEWESPFPLTLSHGIQNSSPSQRFDGAVQNSFFFLHKVHPGIMTDKVLPNNNPAFSQGVDGIL